MKISNKLVICSLITLAIVLSSCSDGIGISGTGYRPSNGGNGGGVFQGAVPITIDSAGIVPVIGQSQTTSVVYVHNNTTQTIDGIAYSAKVNVNKASTGGVFSALMDSAKQALGIKANNNPNNFLEPASALACASIPAGKSCPLVFNTPVFALADAQGSALITASYQFLEKPYSFNQVISYARVVSNMANGAVFNSGVTVYGFGNSIGYGTVYLYGSGVNQIYNITGIYTNRADAVITEGNITGTQLQSNYVQAVEVSVPTGTGANSTSNGFNVLLTATSSSLSNNYISTVNTGVVLTSNSAILTSGLVPLINSSVPNPSGSMYIVNSGNILATIGDIVYPDGVVPLSGGFNQCGATLEPGGGCTLYFKVPQTSGTGNVIVPYTGGDTYAPLNQTITWYNVVGGVILNMTLSSNPLIFDSGVGGSSTVTITNVGGYNLTNVGIPSPVVLSGGATVTAGNLTCTAGGTNLPVGQSCSYTVNVNDTSLDHGYIQLSVSGDYVLGNYKTSVSMGYLSNEFAPILNVSPSVSSMVIIGNGIDMVTKNLVVTNSGSVAASITSSSLFANPSYMTIESDSCVNSVLAVGSSCNILVKLGPKALSTQESGVAVYSVVYNGGNISSFESANALIRYTAQSNQQSLSIESVGPVDSIGGDGESSGTPYIFVGNNTANQMIVITYSNTGTDPITITGINNNNSSISWQLNYSLSTCIYNNTLAVGQTCTVTFDNVLNQNTLAIPLGIGASYEMNLSVPTMIFHDAIISDSQFIVQPSLPISQFPAGGTVIYVNNHQATVANSVVESSGFLIIQNSLANATSYSPIILNAKSENYFIGAIPMPGCSIESSESGIMAQSCTLTPDTNGTDVRSVQYTVDPLYESNVLHVLFGIDTSNQTVSMTPLAYSILLH